MSLREALERRFRAIAPNGRFDQFKTQRDVAWWGRLDPPADSADVDAFKKAHRQLDDDVQDYTLRLKGVLRSGEKREEIDAYDQQHGELDFWKERFKVSRDDVTRIWKQLDVVEDKRAFEAPVSAPVAVAVAKEKPAAPTKHKRASPEQSWAKVALAGLFPRGTIPSQEELPNKLLCNNVNDWLKQHQMPVVKQDLILRAAGRK